MPIRMSMNAIGSWLVNKARRQAEERGTQHAARNLKKQGVPLALAVEILARRPVGVSA